MPCSFPEPQIFRFFPSCEHKLFWILKYSTMTIAPPWFTGELLPSTLLTVPFNFKKVSIKINVYNFYIWPVKTLFPWNCLNGVDADDSLLQYTIATSLRVVFAMNVFILQMDPCMLCYDRQVVKISYWGMPLSQKVSRISDEWSPVALFGSCWYPFHCWLDKCHSTIKYPCLEDLTQMALVRLVCSG